MTANNATGGIKPDTTELICLDFGQTVQFLQQAQQQRSGHEL